MRRTLFSLIISSLVDAKKHTEKMGFSTRRKTQKLTDAISILRTVLPQDGVAKWKSAYVKEGGEWAKRGPV